MNKLTVIGYSANGIYVGSANAEDMDKARYNGRSWLKGSRITTVRIFEQGNGEPIETLAK